MKKITTTTARGLKVELNILESGVFFKGSEMLSTNKDGIIFRTSQQVKKELNVKGDTFKMTFPKHKVDVILKTYDTVIKNSMPEPTFDNNNIMDITGYGINENIAYKGYYVGD